MPLYELAVPLNISLIERWEHTNATSNIQSSTQNLLVVFIRTHIRSRRASDVSIRNTMALAFNACPLISTAIIVDYLTSISPNVDRFPFIQNEV